MRVTNSIIAEKLVRYLHHRLSQDALVKWAENMLMDGEFEPSEAKTIRECLARIGVSDVRVFGLTWEDCERLLTKLGYSVQISVKAA